MDGMPGYCQDRTGNIQSLMSKINTLYPAFCDVFTLVQDFQPCKLVTQECAR